MPYKDVEKQRAYMKEWRAANPDRMQGHRRREVLARAFKVGRLPTPRVVLFHAYTAQELGPIVGRMLELRGIGTLPQEVS